MSPAGVSAGCLRPCVSTRWSRSASTTRAVVGLDHDHVGAVARRPPPGRRRPRAPPRPASARSVGERRPRATRARPPRAPRPARPGTASSSSSRRFRSARNSSLRKSSFIVERSGGARHELVEVDVDLEVAVDRRELLRADRVVGRRAQVLAPLLARDGVEIRVDALHRPEPAPAARPPSCRRCPGTPGDVVRGVALEADEVGHELGADAVALHDPLGRVDDHVGDPARRHHDADVARRRAGRRRGRSRRRRPCGRPPRPSPRACR